MASLPQPRIPLDVMFNILANLPAKTLLRFKCVCKDLFNIIDDPLFIQSHLNNEHEHPSFVFIHEKSLYFGDDIDFPSQALVKFNWRRKLLIIGTCNGLVCLQVLMNQDFIVCNPSTRMFKPVPYPVDSNGNPLMFVQYGFGYDSQHDDYKVVLIGAETWVYSLTSDSWRTLESHLHRTFISIGTRALVYGKGMLHGLVRGEDDPCRPYFERRDYCHSQIARFDLSSEKWDDHDMGLPKPDVPVDGVFSRKMLSFLDGCFCFSFAALTTGFCVESWIMKEYGVKESWTKLLRTRPDPTHSLSLQQPIAYSRARPQAMWLNCNRNKVAVGVACYDMKHETTEKFGVIDTSKSRHGNLKLCVGSLVSIPGSSKMREQPHPPDEHDDTIVSSTLTERMEQRKRKKLS